MLFDQIKTKVTINKDYMESKNLCDRFTEEDLDTIGGMVKMGYEQDKASRQKWENRNEAGLDLAMQIQKEKSYPWPNCSNVIFPLVTIAAMQFSARSYSNIIQGTEVVQYRVIGEDSNGKLRAHADRVSKHMSWQVLEEDTAWEEQHDRLLMNLGITGTNFIKTYYDPAVGHNASELVMARDFVLDYWAKSVDSCARKTQIVHFYRNEIYGNCKSGVFRDVLKEEWYSNLPPVPDRWHEQENRQGVDAPVYADENTPFKALEQHCLFDFDKDGYAEPYIITVEHETGHVLRIVARFDREEDIERNARQEIIRIRAMEYFTKYSFIPAPDGGIYDVGFGVLLGPLNEAVNSGINQLLDNGHMQNCMGGFLGRGAKIRGGVYTVAPWEWKRVDSTGDDLRKSMVPFPDRQPSAVMFQLLSLLIEYTGYISGAENQMIGKNPGQNTPAETSRNTLEQGMQIYGMIFKRVWRSMKEEFKKLHRLNAIYLASKTSFGRNNMVVLAEDYKSNPDLVVPVADPNIASPQMRVAQATAVREAAHMVPGYDVKEAELRWLRALQVQGIETLYPGADKVSPLPNPKVQVEQMKLQGKQMEIEHQKWEFAHEMLNQRKLNDAQIEKLRAEAAKILSEVGVDRAGLQMTAFQAAIDGLEKHNEQMNERLKTLMSGGSTGGDGEGNTDGGGAKVPGVEINVHNEGGSQSTE